MSKKKIQVKARAGLTILDPRTGRAIAVEGDDLPPASVPDNVFWRRRLRDRDVIAAEPEKD